MSLPVKQHWKIAVLDMYEGVPNEGMRCIREILAEYGARNGLQLEVHEFEVRRQQQVPDLSYDIYISTGGPGSPVESEGSEWEKVYFGLVNGLMQWNSAQTPKKPMLFICHSFQLMCRYFQLGEVCRRKSPAFGVFPVHKVNAGVKENSFRLLPDPFYIVDSRFWQVISLRQDKMEAMGAAVLAIEKERPHVPLERAVMAIRFTPQFLGTQFHPEADAAGMRKYLLEEEKKAHVIRHYGEEKYTDMLEQLTDPEKIMLTHNRLIPTFLNDIIYDPSVTHILQSTLQPK
ncbi:GMP synthase [uncultured Chitinophaga sp.]|jgi:GMP synthase - Glutamine amidotransferase domain|uniref:type 1 glutamine amidotransferase n=1 Tax=uncultured Chitinophaga sp. TaxID=339340 RepID=UPI002633B380|nr:GMP synthase [uncultured Chitinophaga sp.]